MTDVFRRKYGSMSGKAIFGYGFHGVTAILALWLLAQAIAA